MFVQQLIAWMQRVPAPLRAEAAGSLARTYFHTPLAPDEHEATEAALTLLLDDPDPAVRRSLAETIAPYAEAPQHILLALLRDAPEIAEPIAMRSPALLEAELVDIVATSGPRLQAAVASRPFVSRPVAAAVAEVGEGGAALALLRNVGAVIPAFSFSRLVERFGEDAAVREALLAREDLPLTVRHAVLSAMTTQLGAVLALKSFMDPGRAGTVVREARDKATVALATTAGGDMPAFVEHLRATGQLSTALLVRAMCAGNIALFEAALARLAGVPVARVFAILSEGLGTATIALFRKAGLPERSHPLFLAALDIWRDTHQEAADDGPMFARRMIERILTRYEGFAESELDDLLLMLRQIAAEAARESARGYIAALAA